MTASDILSTAAAATRWPTLPDAVKAQIADLFLDTLAVTYAGTRHPSFQPWATASAALGKGPLVDALIEGGATTVHQLQDIYRLGRGHPASHIVPAVFARGVQRNATAADLFAAFAAGYECAARIGAALGGLQDLLHDAGTWATIGAAVSAAHLLGADQTQIAQSIDGAAAVTLFPYRATPMAGATIHHLYIGLGAAIGLAAAQSVMAGLTAIPGTLEDFFGPRAGFAFSPAKLTAGISNGTWAQYEMLNAHIKVRPVCAHIATVMDTVTDFVARHGITGADVAEGDVGIYATALQYHSAVPAGDLAARFSIDTRLALTLIKGITLEQDISPADLNDPNVRDLARRILVHHDPALDADYPAGRPSIVTLTLKDGRVLTQRATYPKGDVTNPIDRSERRAKAGALFGANAAAILFAFDTFVAGGAIAPLAEALRSQHA